MDSMKDYVLYRIYDAAGGLLYVGASARVFWRLDTHSKEKPWWHIAAEIKLERFDSLEELLEAEAFAIQAEEPSYNMVHTMLPRGPLGRPPRTRGTGCIYQRADGLWVGAVENGYNEDGKRKRKTFASKNREAVERKIAAAIAMATS